MPVPSLKEESKSLIIPTGMKNCGIAQIIVQLSIFIFVLNEQMSLPKLKRHLTWRIMSLRKTITIDVKGVWIYFSVTESAIQLYLQEKQTVKTQSAFSMFRNWYILCCKI